MSRFPPLLWVAAFLLMVFLVMGFWHDGFDLGMRLLAAAVIGAGAGRWLATLHNRSRP